MSDASSISVLDQLRPLELLDVAQLRRVEREFPAPHADSKGLLKVLLERRWLTPYQANQLGKGCGRELVLGPYLLLSRLSRGGMGDVFLARHRWLPGRQVIVKVIRPDLLQHPEHRSHFTDRFLREGEALARLDHPNIVRVYDAGHDTDRHYLAMEHLDGEDLKQRVERHGPLPLREACDIVRQAAIGLQHVHENGLVHRDVKPANLFRTSTGVVKLLDLGVALICSAEAAAQTDPGLTRLVNALGTPAYVAPEQRADPHAVDTRADIYSLGRTFYTLLTGKVPAPEQMGDDLEPVERLRPDVPAAVAAIVRQMTDVSSRKRYQTPGEVAAALAALRWSDSTLTLLDSATRLGSRLLRPVPLAIAAALLVLTGVTAYVAWPPRQPAVAARPTPVADEPGPVKPSPAPAETVKAPLPRDEPPPRPVEPPAREVPPPRQDDPPAAPVRLTRPLPAGKAPPQPASDAGRYGKSRLLYAHSDKVQSAAFIPGSRRVLSVTYRETLLWDTETDEPVQRRGQLDGFDLGGLRSGERPAFDPADAQKRLEEFRQQTAERSFMADAVAVSPDGRTALLGGSSSAMLWDVEKWQKRAFFGYPHNGIVGSSVGFTADGKYAFYANYDLLVRLYDVKAAKLHRTVTGRVACFSSDGKQLLTGQYSKMGIYNKVGLQLFDVATGQRVKEFGEHRASVSGVALSADGTRALSAGGYENDAVLWDVADGAEVGRLQGHEKPIRSVALSADGRRALTAGDDRTVRLWDVATGKTIDTWRQHTGPVNSVVFSPGERYALTASDDQAVGLWELPRR